MIKKTFSLCKCGEEFVIEDGVMNSFRRDGKRVYPLDAMNDECVDYFRCPTCKECVHESVPGAEYEDDLGMNKVEK